MNDSAKGLLFFLISLTLASWHLDSSLGDNSVSRAAMSAAVVLDGSLEIDRFAQLTKDKAFVAGHYYSEKAPLPALLVVPSLFIQQWVGSGPASADETLRSAIATGGLLCGSVPFALLLVLVWRRSREHTALGATMPIILLAFFGSFLFLYSGTFFGHLLAALFAVLAWRSREKERYVTSGLWIAAAVLCEYPLMLFPAVWALQDMVRKRWTPLLRTIAGGAPGVAVLLLINHAITGNAFSLPYDHVDNYAEERGILGIITPTWPALWGLVWGSYRGLLFYAPMALVAAAAILRQHHGKSIRYWVYHPLVLPCMLLYLLISAHTMWWGGWAYGPRHLTVVAVLFFATGLPLVPKHRGWTLLACTVGTLGAVLAIAAKSTVWGAFPSDVYDPISHVLVPALEQGAWSTMQLPVTFGLAPGRSAAMFAALFAAAVAGLVVLERDPKHQP